MNLIDLLSRNHSLFKKMQKLASKQEKLIGLDNIYEFLDISSHRKRIQQEISSNEMKYHKQGKKGVESGSKDKIRQLTSEIEAIVSFIRQVDQRTADLLEMKKDDLSSEIKGFRKGQKAIKGYSSLTVKSPRFIDREG